MRKLLSNVEFHRPLAHRLACVALVVGLLFSAPFAFFPKNEIIGLLAFLCTSAGLALAGSLKRLTKRIALTHALALCAALMLFFYHRLDLLYVKFMLSLVLSFQFCLADRRLLEDVRDWLIYFGARGAVLAILSFAVYFAFDFAPFYRTLLADERSLPFFGLTNINFGFENPEIVIFARPAFLFDEPGQFAHFVLLLLALIATAGVAARRWRKETVLLAISGLATFSLAFFIVAGIYLSTKLLRWKSWLILASLCIAAYALSDNPLVEALQWRLGSADTTTSDDNRAVSGDNRTRELELALEAFRENPVWGAGWSDAERTVGHFAANPLGPLGYSGLMALLLYLPLLERLYTCAVRSRNFQHLLVILLVALFFSQRPYFYFPIFIFLMEVLRRQILATPPRRRATAIGLARIKKLSATRTRRHSSRHAMKPT